MADRSIIEIIMRARGGAQVKGELKGVAKGAVGVEKSARSAGRGLVTLTTAATAAGATLGYGLYRGARRSLEAFAESEQVAAQTEARLKSTGRQAGVTGRQIAGYAATLQGVTGIDDEVIQSAENMELTFRKIRHKAFKPTLNAALDLSAGFTAMGKNTTPTDAMLMLGKAVNTPSKGMAKLQRQGIEFTDQQKEQAVALEESGKLWAAQRIVLREVEKEFGGSAKAAGKTTTGAMNKLSGAVENAQEAIGMGLAPAVSYAADGLTKFVNGAIPDIARLSKGLDATFGRKDLDMAGKLAVASRQVRSAGEPYAEELVQGLKDAHLDDKLEGAVEWAIPKIAHGAATAAPRAASAFVNAWLDADPWAKIAITGFAAYKLRGPLTKAGSKALDWFEGGMKGGKGVGGLLGGARGMTPANPVFVRNVGGGLPGSDPLGGPLGKADRTPKLARYAKSLGKWSLVLAPGILLGESGLMPNNNNPTTGMAAARMRARANPGSGVIGMPPSRTATSVTVDGRTYPVDPRLAGYPDSHPVATAPRIVTMQATAPIQLTLTDKGKPLAEAMAKFTVQTRERNHR
jgi:hypothetical protein